MRPPLPPLILGLAGFGTVGTGLARILLENRETIIARIGREIIIGAILVRDKTKKRTVPIPDSTLLTDSQDSFFSSSKLDVVVELIGGIEPAQQIIQRALCNGINVVTANKALLAEAGSSLFILAQQKEKHLAFEASVCGGIPIVQTLREGLAANKIQSVTGILNGTSNYILSEMTQKGLPFNTVLNKAQELGYAEADPTLDIEGLDAAHKLALLIRLAWNLEYPFADLPVQGITNIDPIDIVHANEFGYAIKLIGQAQLHADKLEAGVFPTLVPHETLLAEVAGAFNAVHIHGNAVGPIFLYGKGAGDLPTGSAVAADIFAIARNTPPNNSGFVSNKPTPPIKILSPKNARCSYYIRLQLPDATGVLRDVAGIMADNDISIAKAIQKGEATGLSNLDRTNAPRVPLIIMTHQTSAANMDKALLTMQQSKLLQFPPAAYRVLDLKR